MKDINTIAKQLNMTPNAISLRILRAREKLKEKWKEEN